MKKANYIIGALVMLLSCNQNQVHNNSLLKAPVSIAGEKNSGIDMSKVLYLVQDEKIPDLIRILTVEHRTRFEFKGMECEIDTDFNELHFDGPFWTVTYNSILQVESIIEEAIRTNARFIRNQDDYESTIEKELSAAEAKELYEAANGKYYRKYSTNSNIAYEKILKLQICSMENRDIVKYKIVVNLTQKTIEFGNNL